MANTSAVASLSSPNSSKGRAPRTAAQAWCIIREAIQGNISPIKNKGKKVRFTRSTPEQHVTPSSYFDPCGDLTAKETLWYQPADYLHFRRQAAIDAKDIKVNMHALVDCIADAYGTACKTASKTLSEANLSKSLEKLEADVRLTFWGHGGHNRGIERCLRNTIIKKNGLKAKISYTTVVITSQLKCTAEELRKKCESNSRQDRIFARMMGEADACIAMRSAKFWHPTKLEPMGTYDEEDDPIHSSEFHTLREDTIHRRQLFPRQA